MKYKQVVKLIIDIAMSAAFATLSYYGKKLLQMKSRQTKI